ncbi:unknown protein [Simkania negevensis Z]|uniref:Uncharacterized protein n=1 Tax=Simkania negevensis (strain ATCC VR-1471 / DSM 27360 / Z) TaxID=331113 RepID=F8L4F0_SIMNZ|nr:unknown protein [Simkania negevensis Z]
MTFVLILFLRRNLVWEKDTERPTALQAVGL